MKEKKNLKSFEDICEENNILKRNKRKYYQHIYIMVVLGIFLLLSILVLFKKTSSEDFKFKSITTTCQGFQLSGSIDYDKVTSAIYISNINYCGKNNRTVYDKIMATLYEKNNDEITEIDSYKLVNNIKLEDYLKNSQFKFPDYMDRCMNYTDKSLYLKVTVYENERSVVYLMPLSLNNSCSK